MNPIDPRFRSVDLPPDPKALEWAEKLVALLRDRDLVLKVAAVVVVDSSGHFDYLAVGHEEEPLLLTGALECLKLKILSEELKEL